MQNSEKGGINIILKRKTNNKKFLSKRKSLPIPFYKGDYQDIFQVKNKIHYAEF